MKVKINKKNFDCDIACIVASQAHWKYVPLPTFLQKKRTYMYESLQFPVEINTRGSKTLKTFISFHKKFDLQHQSHSIKNA